MEKLIEYIEKKQFTRLKTELMNMQEADIAEFLEELDIKFAVLAFRLLPKEIAADVFSHLPPDLQYNLSILVQDDELVEIIDELYFDDMIDFLEEVPANVVKKILGNATETKRKLINQFLNYPDDSAGSLMTIEFVDLKKEMTVGEAMNRIRRIGLDKETIYTCYVINSFRVLEGIVSLKDLVLADPQKNIEDLMRTSDIIHVHTHDDQEEIADLFKKYDLLSLPVVDQEKRFVGIITIDDVVDVIEQETTEDFQRMAALEPSEEEYINAGIFGLARKRIVWLIILMFSATLTELILNTYQGALSSVVALTFFIPMLTGTGGNAGSQAATLVIRSITLGEIEFKDVFRVLWKEIRVGLVVGISLACLNFLRLKFVQGYIIKISLTVAMTMICTITLAAIMGGILPLIAKRIKLDPAIMASPLISTIVDASTLIIYFSFAKIILGL